MYASACLRVRIIINYGSVKEAVLAGRAVVHYRVTKVFLGAEVLRSATHKRVNSKGPQVTLLLDSGLIHWVALVGLDDLRFF